jgi:glutathione S-transferase
MRLRSSLTSPFVRKVRIAAALLGLSERIALEPADTMDPADALRRVNPLGRVPALELDDGTTIVDSRVICDYLNALAGGALLPADPKARARAHSDVCLADGVCEASVLIRYETAFHDEPCRSSDWVAHQAQKVARTLAHFEANPPKGPVDLVQIALACALGYRDFRFGGAWRADHPNLVAWLDDFAARTPAFADTAPPA